MSRIMVLPSQFKQQLAQAVAAAAATVSDEIYFRAASVLERPRNEAHGDYSSPLPLMLAKRLRRNPYTIARHITAVLMPLPFVASTDVAAPGFINFTIADEAKTHVVGEILKRGKEYGTQPTRSESLLLEFISANPTGPLHVGHGRACAYGDALANILEAVGVDVRREYYINNAGRQMDILTASVWLRHWIKKDKEAAMPAGAYRGSYLIAAAAALAGTLVDTQPPAPTLFDALGAATDDDTAADMLVAAAKSAIGSDTAYNALRQQIGTFMMDEVIKRDMQSLHVDVEKITFFSEMTLFESGKVDTIVQKLQKRGALQEKDGALWFNASAYGDEKDRVVRRANDEPTYFAADIAYHVDKLSRPHPPQNSYKIINVLGADHHGYVPRLSAAIQALGFAADSMEAKIIQFVALFENGKRLKMSTRAGEFVTLQQLVEAVGVEAARYYYLNRKNDQHLDFDMTAAKAQEKKNPIYYLQYAHARICRVMEHWGGDKNSLNKVEATALAKDAAAVRLCGSLIRYPELVLAAANEHAPHLLTVYLHTLAGELHNFYEQTRILPRAGASPAPEMTARLALLAATKTVLDNGAELLGLRLPEKM